MNRQSLSRQVKKPQSAKKKVNKHGNHKVTYDGHKFDSKAEYRYYLRLKQQLIDGVITKIELQKSFVLIDGFVKNKKKYQAITYKADFVVTYPDGEEVVVDVKGNPKVTVDFAMKFKLFHLRYPNRFIIARYNYNTGQFTEKETLR